MKGHDGTYGGNEVADQQQLPAADSGCQAKAPQLGIRTIVYQENNKISTKSHVESIKLTLTHVNQGKSEKSQ